MSKIYEALLRAELERAITGTPAEPGTTVSVDELKRPSNEPLPLMAYESPASVYNGGSAPLQETAPTPLAPVLDLSAVSQQPWVPNLTSLPALGDRGPAVEQFRSLRSHLVEFREQAPTRTVLVSSGLPGEGKSFVALNLALSFARHKGNRVLLIDGDMRRSSLHRLLGAPREPGLTEYLSGEASLMEVLQRPLISPGTVLPAGLASLTFIGGGKDADKAGDLAANARFPEMIARVSSTFDWIVVDSSPANLVSDAVSLARACDGVLLVARQGVTKYKTAQEVQTQFKASRVLGFVLNAMHKLPKKGDYYTSYGDYGSPQSEA